MDHEWTAGGNTNIVFLERVRASGYGELFRVGAHPVCLIDR